MVGIERQPWVRDAYNEPSKLAARQKLWSYADRVWETGRIRSVLDLDGCEVVVDIGCGNGRDLAALRCDGHTGPVIGVDFSTGMLASIGVDIAIPVNTDATALPLADSWSSAVAHRGSVTCPARVRMWSPAMKS
jgi:ubiquinone/menaquinone biosynthesis C-methylase UbiE